jgi:hypothetical protein
MAEVVEGYECVVEVEGVGWRWVDATFGPASALALIDEGCQRYTITLRVSPALC